MEMIQARLSALSGLHPDEFKASPGFTLIELLAVMALIGIISLLTLPALSSLESSMDFGQAVSGISGLLEQARAAALSDNAYVYVGFAEVDGSQARSANPQAPGVGRIAISIIEMPDGTRGYTPGNIVSTWGSSWPPLPLSRLQVYDNLHMVTSTVTPPASGPLVRPLVSVNYQLGATTSETPFSYPFSTIYSSSGGQYLMNRVIQFDSRGAARIESATNGELLDPQLEITLQPTHGDILPTAPVNGSTTPGNFAAIQIDGITGAVQVYRP